MQNDYNTLDFKATGSSPFETKWRGSLSHFVEADRECFYFYSEVHKFILNYCSIDNIGSGLGAVVKKLPHHAVKSPNGWD
jgi:hypothetical protein